MGDKTRLCAMEPHLQLKRSPQAVLKLRTARSVGQRLNLSVPETKIAEFANSIDLDEVAHYEPPLQDQHCLPFSFRILNMKKLELDIFCKFEDENFVVCFW